MAVPEKGHFFDERRARVYHSSHPPARKIAHLTPELLIEKFVSRLFLFWSSGVSHLIAELVLVVRISPGRRGVIFRLRVDQRVYGLGGTQSMNLLDLFDGPSEPSAKQEM